MCWDQYNAGLCQGRGLAPGDPGPTCRSGHTPDGYPPGPCTCIEGTELGQLAMFTLERDLCMGTPFLGSKIRGF